MDNRHRRGNVKWQNSNLTAITHHSPVLCLRFNLFFVFITTYMLINFILVSEFDKNKVFRNHKCFFDIIHGIFVYDVLLFFNDDAIMALHQKAFHLIGILWQISFFALILAYKVQLSKRK